MHKDDAMLAQESKQEPELETGFSQNENTFATGLSKQKVFNNDALSQQACQHQSCDKYDMHEEYDTPTFRALYKPKILTEFSPAVFNTAHWQAQGVDLCSASGRGRVYRFKVNETECILRHYRRGGLMRIFSSDCFIRLPFARSRAENEFLLLDELAKRGLPVPRPVACGVKRNLLFCKMDIIVEALDCSENLVECLSRTKLEKAHWQNIGQVIRKFHDEGVYHADLNAHNILVCDQNAVYLLDFDKSELRGNLRSENWKAANLARLKRSLLKETGLHERFYFNLEDWQALSAGYQNKE